MSQLDLSPQKVKRALSFSYTRAATTVLAITCIYYVFLPIPENIAQEKFRVFALPNDKGVTACFSSAPKDVSYMCQEDSGDKEKCRLCIALC